MVGLSPLGGTHFRLSHLRTAVTLDVEALVAQSRQGTVQACTLVQAPEEGQMGKLSTDVEKLLDSPYVGWTHRVSRWVQRTSDRSLEPKLL